MTRASPGSGGRRWAVGDRTSGRPTAYRLPPTASEALARAHDVVTVRTGHDVGIVRQGDHWLELRPAGARRLKRFRVPAQLAEACLINLPVLKTHVVSGMSMAMKNLMGLLPREDRRAMHMLGIQQCIVDMNRGLAPALSIVDGSVGQDGDGPLY